MKRILLIVSIGILLSSCSKRVLDFAISEPSVLTAPAQHEMINKSMGYDSYRWILGDGTTAEDSIVSHRYYLSGKYLVTLQGRKGKKVKSVTKEIVVSPPESCLVRIETNFGDMLVELYDETPLHRDNFVKLADGGFYDSLLFHRVIDGFMIQGGDPASKNARAGARLGTGGPGYQIDAEFVPAYAHTKGAIAAARRGGPSNPQKRSSGSQFYIVHGKKVRDVELDQIERSKGFEYTDETREEYAAMGGAPFLDQDYTVFGRVIEGMEVIDKIAQSRTDRSDRPTKDVLMKVSVIK